MFRLTDELKSEMDSVFHALGQKIAPILVDSRRAHDAEADKLVDRLHRARQRLTRLPELCANEAELRRELKQLAALVEK